MPANPHIQGDERIRTAVSVKPAESRQFVGPRGAPSFVTFLALVGALAVVAPWVLAVGAVVLTVTVGWKR